MVKNLPTMQETWVGCLGRGRAPAEEKATHSSVLTWRTPWTEEPDRPESLGRKESDKTEQLSLLLFI